MTAIVVLAVKKTKQNYQQTNAHFNKKLNKLVFAVAVATTKYLTTDILKYGNKQSNQKDQKNNSDFLIAAFF